MTREAVTTVSVGCGRTLVSIMEIPINCVPHYGVLHGVWDENETPMKVDKMVEKPTDDYVKENLGV